MHYKEQGHRQWGGLGESKPLKPREHPILTRDLARKSADALPLKKILAVLLTEKSHIYILLSATAQLCKLQFKLTLKALETADQNVQISNNSKLEHEYSHADPLRSGASHKNTVK